MTDRDRPKAYLVLEDGLAFEGRAFGRYGERCGEVVFNTAMTGYQEILTDPSYRGQMVCMTYPHIGNYGVNREDVEASADKPWVDALIVRELSPVRSNWRATQDLHDYLADAGIPGIEGIDTRALVLHLRTHGALRACLSTESGDVAALQRKAQAHPKIDGCDLTTDVTRKAAATYSPEPTGETAGAKLRRVVALDYGMKENIVRLLRAENFEVTVLPSSAKAADVLAAKPEGLFLSNGPGDPSAVKGAIETIREVVTGAKIPTFGICLGHQLLGHALGGRTFKLKFGHHGANHPVKDLITGRIEITSQNHNFAVDPESVSKDDVEITHWNLNDGSVEGLRHKKLPLFAVQFHPEAAPGPHDSQRLFRRFRELIDGAKK